jgi:hypothetical protein
MDILRGGQIADDPYGFVTPAETRAPQAPGEAPRDAEPEGAVAPADGFDPARLRAALAVPISRQKWNIEAPRALMQRVARLSYQAGEMLDRKRVNEYHIVLGALLSLPDPDDPQEIRRFLETIAAAVPDYADS